MTPRPLHPLIRFKNKVSVNNVTGCWNWTAALFSKTGYASFEFEGRTQLGHRVAYIWFRGPIPEGLELDHLCRNCACVNPMHLEAVTHKENWRRSNQPGAIIARTNQCSHGHELTPENTYVYPQRPTQRICRKCRQNAYTARRGKRG